MSNIRYLRMVKPGSSTTCTKSEMVSELLLNKENIRDFLSFLSRCCFVNSCKQLIFTTKRKQVLHSFLRCIIALTSRIQAFSCSPQPPRCMNFPSPPTRTSSAAMVFLVRDCTTECRVMHHQMILSRDKKTSFHLSGHPGLQGGLIRSRRRSVRHRRRGKYNAKGGSSPVT